MTSFLSSFNKQNSIAIVGLGYVGLPLAVEFGKKIFKDLTGPSSDNSCDTSKPRTMVDGSLSASHLSSRTGSSKAVYWSQGSSGNSVKFLLVMFSCNYCGCNCIHEWFI